MTDSPHLRQVDDDVLAKYLHSHLIAGTSGTRLFEDAAKAWEGTFYASALDRLAKEVSEDAEELGRMVQALGLEPPAHRKAAGWAAEQAAKIDPLNPTHAASGRAGQLQLESLLTAATGKCLLWKALLLLIDEGLPVDATRLQQLQDRALHQISTLSEILRSVTAANFRAKGLTQH
ncbi:hypothetical protein SA2016_2916 [Sinomonas atrocyanea]|uniref:Uncharacterized protein n=1 Tax=Sinomonas atrocyanea TaxID=37927 RepID=A0A127A3V3_9MICC|nr:hypothetical protein [Sinomonas atrocyanea]AMM33581.1 hypothetical protein SA2016_2916 [Sinomonas atrocyanea]GEB66376.1 hypothetical protein SAT01_38240 [Sinomonas atrocyanea]GGG71917.1 hypothetical protein GCM10007172_25340 [Sinomonas atrocyanea]